MAITEALDAEEHWPNASCNLQRTANVIVIGCEMVH